MATSVRALPGAAHALKSATPTSITTALTAAAGRAARRPKAAWAGAVRRNRSWLGLNIPARQAEAADRAVPRGGESDLVVGKAGASARPPWSNPPTRDAGWSARGAGQRTGHWPATAVRLPPAHVPRSLTCDPGHRDDPPRPGHRRHRQLGLLLHAHSPWLPGSNENSNGLQRQH
jgi:IS30 family transposase